MVPHILSYFPGQKATFFLETKNASGARVDSATLPTVTRIFAFTSTDGYSLFDGYLGDDGYTQAMHKVDTGLYYVQVSLPKTANSVGSYLVDITYTDPVSSLPAIQTYQVIVNAPFGNYSTTSG